MTNYKAPAVKISFKTRTIRFFGVTAIFVSLGLMIVGADQLGHWLQTHRAGYVNDNH